MKKVTIAVGNAATALFVTEDEAKYLFIPNSSLESLEGRNENDATPKYVARKIEKFVKARESGKPTLPGSEFVEYDDGEA